ncbi:hypothetical protein H0H87_011156 [Tephrocybe sp. NHM501043]|nr:hypothetical protein H0H87_011156 [Tephrocybe sp. NHM501043]
MAMTKRAELRTPHDSPSLTLARLRVSDDHDGPSGYYPMHPSSSQGASRPTRERLPPPRSQTPFMDQHEQAHQSSQRPSFSKPHHTSSSPEQSFKPFSTNSAYSHEVHHLSRTRHSYAQEPIDPSSYALRRHSTIHASTHSSVYVPSEDERTPIARYGPRVYDYPSQQSRHPIWPDDISTTGQSLGRMIETKRTPVVGFGGGNANQGSPQSSKSTEDGPSGVAASKYECSYCGKAFNRPSSLKIHLNSHTGAKPFVCPVESCGRSFSVLSNMRRHARVHTQTSLHTDPSSDEDSERSSFAGSGSPSATLIHSRRSSTASVSSSGSRRSHASEDDSAYDDVRPEKRFRA